jgi:8-oxo-dGTP pyrophosphatase MutT (NUDIX family)
MNQPTTVARNLRPAATVIVLRDAASGPEVFMVRRHQDSPFMGGAWVFPGGRVDPADAGAADVSWCDGLDIAEHLSMPPATAVAHRLAALRELFEEAGVLLARDTPRHFVSLAEPAVRERFAQYRHDVHAGTISLKTLATRERVRVSLDALVPFARWITPPLDPRQFDASFYVTRMPPDQTPVADATETTHEAWLKPAAAIARAQAQEITLPPPTWTTLRELESFATVDAAIHWAAHRRIEPREPLLHTVGGEHLLLLPGDPLSPQPWHEPPPIETRFRFASGQWTPERASR